MQTRWQVAQTYPDPKLVWSSSAISAICYPPGTVAHSICRDTNLTIETKYQYRLGREVTQLNASSASECFASLLCSGRFSVKANFNFSFSSIDDKLFNEIRIDDKSPNNSERTLSKVDLRFVHKEHA